MNRLFEIVLDEIKKILSEEDYRGEHTAPSTDSAPMHDLTDTYPDDIYSDVAARRYKHYGDHRDNQPIEIIQGARNKPNQPVKIYRAVPDVSHGINNGDWVTIDKEYAKGHGESHLKGQYEIVTKTVPARNLYTDANDIFEWGYYVN